MALAAAAREAAECSPSRLRYDRTNLPMDVFRRTPVESFECVLPIILTDKLDGDMTEKAEAIAHLSWELRGLIEFFLRQPECTSKHVTETVRDRLKAAQKRVTNAKEYYRDLVHACYLVAKTAKEQIASGDVNSGYLLSGVCLLLGGEATVEIGTKIAQNTDHAVNGGRCSHAALVAALRWFDLRNNYVPLPQSVTSTHIGFFARASDGLDGPSAFGAGAWSTEEMISDAAEAHFARQCLAAGDSYGFFVNSHINEELGHFLPACLTGTNVMDLFMCIIGVFA